MAAAPRNKTAKGPKPALFANPDTDRLLAIVMALAGEVAVLRERLDTHEQLAAAGQPGTEANIEAYEADADTIAARDAWRAGYLQRVFRAIEPSSDSRGSVTIDERSWESVIAEVGS